MHIGQISAQISTYKINTLHSDTFIVQAYKVKKNIMLLFKDHWFKISDSS